MQNGIILFYGNIWLALPGMVPLCTIDRITHLDPKRRKRSQGEGRTACGRCSTESGVGSRSQVHIDSIDP